jgi:quercetin dioxygenase-like cupin family protein
MRSRPGTEFGRVEKYTIDEAEEWMEYSEIALADVANEDDAPAMKLGAVGFTRAPGGAESSFDFAYDEVLVVTEGSCTVRSHDRELTAGPGDVIYLPTGVPGTFRADTDHDLVYVASSPYGEMNRAAKAALLLRTGAERGRPASMSSPIQRRPRKQARMSGT